MKVFEPKLWSMIKTYSKKQFFSDLNAGLIVGVVALPLSIAFAIASGVSPEKGLITSIVAGFIVSLIGGSSVQINGPTGAFVLILSAIVAQFGFEGLVIASIMAGIIQVLMGIFRFGVLFKFIPYPLVIGFNTGIALSIFTSQVPDVLGLKLENTPSHFVQKWIAYFSHITEVDPIAIVIATVTILIIVLTPRIFKKAPAMLIAILAVTIISYLLKNHCSIPIETIGDRFEIASHLPRPSSISFGYDTIELLIPSAITIAIMGSIVTILTANIADGATGDRHHTNTELIAQGAANIITPLFGGIPSTGAIARTMTNINTGGRTPIAGITHSIIVLIILVFLGKLAQHIPTACLAGMLFVVSYNMSDWHTLRALFRNPRADVAVMLTTLLLTVFFNLTIAVEVGLLMAIILFMRRINEVVHVNVLRDELDLHTESDFAHNDEVLNIEKGVEVYEIDGPFFFGIANKFEEQMRIIGDRPKVRIIRMRKVPFIDSTGIHNLEMFVRSSRKEGIHIILSGVHTKVHQALEKAQFEKEIGEDNIFRNITDAVAAANLYAKKQ